VSTGTIVALARDFAGARRPLAICGQGQGHLPGNLQEFLAIHTLNALVGNINRTGGIWAVPEPEYIDWPELEMDGVASGGFQQPRVDGAGSIQYPNARYLLNRLPAVINASQESPVELLFVSNANPVFSLQDTAAVKKAFEKISMKVSFSSYMDETAAMADLVLPDHVFLERFEDVPAASGYPKPFIGLAKPVVEPLYNTRHVGDVIIQMAKELGHNIGAAFPWEDYATCLEKTLGDKWDALVEEGYWVDNEFNGTDWANAFETDSSKFEFTNNEIIALADYSPLKPEGDETLYPLLLVPYDTMRINSDYVGSPPFLIKALEDTILKGNLVLVEINPETAKALGLSDGQDAKLTTPKDSGRVKVYFSNGVMPGVVAIPRGLGHTAYDKFLTGKGVNYNQLSSPAEDPASGHNAAWGIQAKLSKA
jgi:anaerobic selenocysteine-containing dehydrogenase